MEVACKLINIKLFVEAKRANENAAVKFASRFQVSVKVVIMIVNCLMLMRQVTIARQSLLRTYRKIQNCKVTIEML